MALLNIGAGNQDDAFYRYKMPKMITKIEGRGNGIKTNIVNMVDIAKALGRPASYTTKYFGIELGAQSKFDDKTGTSHVNGSHETSKLASLLEVFINKYVQCYGCGNPETDIVITKSHIISLKCAACGFISEVDMRDKLTTFIVKNPPDHHHEQKKGSGSNKDKKSMRRAEKERLKEGEIADEEQKKLKNKDNASSRRKGTTTPKSSLDRKKLHPSDEDCFSSSANEVETPTNDDLDSEDDEVEWQTDTSSEAAMQRIQEQLNSVTSGMVMISTTGEEKAKSSLSKSASRDKLVGLRSVKSRDKLISDEVIKSNEKPNQRLRSSTSRENLHQDNNVRLNPKLRAVKSRENLMYGIKENNKRVSSHHRLKKVSSIDSIVDETDENVKTEYKLKVVNSQDNLVVEIKDYLKNVSPAVEQLKSFLGSLSGTHQEIVGALFEALFNEVGKGFSKEVVKKKNLLAAATPDDGSQLVLLHSIESFCEKASPDAVKEVALVLKSLYDNDVLEENFIFEWYHKGIKGENKDSMIWKNVKPFVEWLQSAESETEGE